MKSWKRFGISLCATLFALACSSKSNPGETGGTAGAGGNAGSGGTADTGGNAGTGGTGGLGGGNQGVDGGSGRSSAIASGNLFNCALSVGGAVKCWGDNSFAALGQGDLDARGDAPGEMGDKLAPIALGTGRTAVGIAAGVQHACAALDDGSVKCWGANDKGQLGLGDTSTRGDAAGEMGDALPAVALGAGSKAVAVSAIRHTCVLFDNGQVKCWGNNSNGQLGLGDTKARGTLAGDMGDNLPFVALGTGRTAVAISVGDNHTCAVLDNGSLKCWGLNHSGQLGLGDMNDRGDAPNEMGDALPAADLGAGRKVIAVAAGGAHTCALLDNGQMKCWGDPSAGQVGLGDNVKRGDEPGELGDSLPPVDLGTGRTAKKIAAGPEHTCAVLDNGQVKCWGLNSSGGLGVGDTKARGRDPGEMGDALPAVDLGTGRQAGDVTVAGGGSCALLDDRAVKCWGLNFGGVLGQGDMKDRGGMPGQLGDSLPPIPLF